MTNIICILCLVGKQLCLAPILKSVVVFDGSSCANIADKKNAPDGKCGVLKKDDGIQKHQLAMLRVAKLEGSKGRWREYNFLQEPRAEVSCFRLSPKAVACWVWAAGEWALAYRPKTHNKVTRPFAAFVFLITGFRRVGWFPEEKKENLQTRAHATGGPVNSADARSGIRSCCSAGRS